MSILTVLLSAVPVIYTVPSPWIYYTLASKANRHGTGWKALLIIVVFVMDIFVSFIAYGFGERLWK